MVYPPAVHRVLAGLARAELAGVNAHTLAVALARAEVNSLTFDRLDERQIALALLELTGYPDNAAECSAFLAASPALSPLALTAEAISDAQAPRYARWLAGFLNDPDPNVQRNARLLLRWLAANRRAALAADAQALDPLRLVADDPETSTRNSAYIVHALGLAGTLDDYDRVIRHAELVIQHDLEHLDLVAEGLRYLYPPALVNALAFFLDHTPGTGNKQFVTGMHLLSAAADIEDRAFWATYSGDMEAIVDRLQSAAGRNHAVERVLDQIEKRLAQAALED
jgi:hypothetical protein